MHLDERRDIRGEVLERGSERAHVARGLSSQGSVVCGCRGGLRRYGSVPVAVNNYAGIGFL